MSLRGRDLVSRQARGLAHSPASAQLERVRARRASGETVFAAAMGQSPFPVPTRMVEALRAHAHEKHYLPVEGLPELRRAIAGYVERRLGIDRTADDILVGPGTKELAFLLRITWDGTLLVPTPTWPTYAAQATLLDAPIATVSTRSEDGYRLRPDDLERACAESDASRPRMLVLTYPSSPTGLTYRSEELREIARVAERHDLVILADEIYGELHHKNAHASIARWYGDGTIVATGLSKWLGAGGWRLGALAFPEVLRPLLAAPARVAGETFTSTAAPIQHAAVVAFDGGADVARYLASARRVLTAAGRYCARRLVAAGAECAQPTGAFYVFPSFEPLRARLEARGIATSRALAERLLDETGVALLPGSAFGRPEAELTARIAYVDFDGRQALEAVEIIPQEQPLDETFLRRHCPRVVEAVARIAAFVAP